MIIIICILGYFVGAFATLTGMKLLGFQQHRMEELWVLSTIFWPIAIVIFTVFILGRGIGILFDKGSDMFIEALTEKRE